MKNEHPQQDDIAVVGASVLFPGSIGNESFWSNILEGTDFMTDTPDDHWLIEDYLDADPTKRGKTYASRGAFIPKVDFDPLKYGMPPNKLSSADTAQLLALIVAEKVLDDAISMQFNRIDRKRISVILGMAAATELMGQVVSSIQRPVWVKALRESGIPESQVIEACDRIESSYPNWDEATFPGLLGNVVAGRIANRMDLGGTNCVIDAACASSLGAVSMAIQELKLGQSDMVITGGVDALNDIFMFMCFSKTPALSKTGDCRPFSDRADGTMLGEGLGMVALRRLKDAERDGDKIYAVIKGIGTSSDGLAKSIYAPRPEGQELAIRRAYESAGYLQEDVELIEAHGTATKAGDIAEFQGLMRAFSDSSRKDRQYCALGSVKSQIGHTKAAAGSASLFKIVMALHHKVLPPTIKVDKPNPELDIENSPFYLNTRPRPWIHEVSSTRKASVSSFGFGGSNFHIACEEYIQKTPANRFHQSPVELMLFSGNDVNEIEAQIRNLLKESDSQPLANLARNSQERFIFQERFRLAILAATLEDLRFHTDATLNRIKGQPEKPFSMPNKVHYNTGNSEPKVAFLFPGQGSQYVNMGAELAMHFDAARRVWDQAASLALNSTTPLHQIVFPIPVFDEQARGLQESTLKQTEWAQPALGCVSTSMLAILNQLGLKPSAAAGHSYGEITALHASGAIESLEHMLQISRKRGELMAEAASGKTKGTMTAVFIGAKQMEEMLASWESRVTLANVNSPRQVVLAGTIQDIELCESQLKGQGIRFKRLPVATAFHSSIVSPSAEPFRRFLQTISFSAPHIPVYSNTTGKAYPCQDEQIRQMLAQQLAKPVLFEQIVENMFDSGIRIFLEVGAGSALTGMVKDTLKDQTITAIALDSKQTDGRIGIWNALGALSVEGCPMDFKSLWQEFAVSPALVPKEKPSPVTVQLNGANYGKPYPPKNGAAGIPKPNSEHVERTKPLNTTSPSPQINQTASKDHDPQWLVAFQAMQQHMHEAQIAFQNTMSESHHAFLKASEAAFLQLGRQASPAGSAVFQASDSTKNSASPAVPPVQKLTIQQPAKNEPGLPGKTVPDFQAILFSVVSDKTGYPIEMLELDLDMEAGLGIDSIKRVEIISALLEALPQALPEASSEASPALASIDLNQLTGINTLGGILSFLAGQTNQSGPTSGQRVPKQFEEREFEPVNGESSSILLGIVSEKTGYPAEMLNWEMAMESELGIDSIKRVEILSAIQDRFPRLASADMTRMIELKTLADIRDFMEAEPRPESRLHTAPVAAPPVDHEQLLKSVVAEKTGYPVEMLDMSMELESGLGIDSIKRVEILSALQTGMPLLETADMTEMASLKTLGELAGFMASQLNEQPSESTQSSIPHDDTEKILFQVVADKTGYPVEMLSLEMEMESGLGIDSIKRVEILSALQDRLPQCANMDMTELGSLNTLAEILGCISQGIAAPKDVTANTEAMQEQPAQLDDTLKLERSVLTCVPATASGVAMAGLFEAKIYILKDEGNIAQHLAKTLKSAGLQAEVVSELPPDAQSIVVFGGMAPHASSDVAITVEKQLFQQIQTCAENMYHKGCLLVTVQSTGGFFGTKGVNPWSCGTAALAKTARQEWPASVKAIDVDTEGLDAETIALRISKELLSGGPELEVGLTQDGNRCTLSLSQEETRAEELSFEKGDTIVVSGGARGVTAACLLALGKHTPLSFAVLGRTLLSEEPGEFHSAKSDAELKKAILGKTKQQGRKVSPQQLNQQVQQILAAREVQNTLGQLRSMGCQVAYYPVDVCDLTAVEEALDHVRTQFGGIHGVIHAAGVIADKNIHEKTQEQFNRVFDTKVIGLKNLLEATCKDSLKQLTVFSSVAGRTGNKGQVDYAMANEILNRVCQAEQIRRGNQCRVKSLGWGPWQGGMVRPELAAVFKQRGIPLIPLQAGADFFVEELQGERGGCELVFGGSLEHEGHAPSHWASTPTTWKIWLHDQTFPYLKSHVIQGVPVVPVALVSHICLSLARHFSFLGKHVSLSDLKVLHGIKCHGFFNEGDWLTVACHSKPGSKEVKFSITDASETLCYQLRIQESSGQAKPRQSVKVNGLNPWKVDPKDVYRDQLFHGTDFQVIHALQGISDSACEAQLKVGKDIQSEIPVFVGILDGALQLGLLWEHQRSQHASLPTGIKAMRLYQEFQSDQIVRCVLKNTQQNQLSANWNVFFLDEHGITLAEIEGMAIHVLLNGQTKTKSDSVSVSAN